MTDDRRAFCRKVWLDFTGAEPTVGQLDYLVDFLRHNGSDALVGGIFDGEQAKAFRAKRGW